VIWGIDVGTARIAFACGAETRTLTIASERGARRLALAHDALKAYSLSLARAYPPLCVFVEQPSGQHVNPSLSYMAGVIQSAVYQGLAVLYANPVSVWTITSSEWKALLGLKGNAPKEAVLEWARAHGFKGSTQDEADAFGIAWAGALLTAEKAA